jgi:endonuclease-3
MTMTKKEKAAFAASQARRVLPAHHHPARPCGSVHLVLVAVLLSAQCTDKKVNEITPLLFAKARTPQQMMKLSVEEIQDIIRPCGLVTR